MSKISRIRILNLNYNNNTIKIDDETFDLGGQNTLISLRNGGGKSVLVQMIVSLFVNRTFRDFGDRPFKSYFTTNRPTFLMTEWQLDNGRDRFLAGMMVRKNQKEDNDAEALEMYTFTGSYSHACKYDLDNIPVVRQDGNRKILKGFSECKTLMEDLCKKETGDFRLYDMTSQYGRRQYFATLRQYQINNKEWESIIRKVNQKESGLSELFQNATDEKDLVENWFLRPIEEKLNQEKNKIDEFRKLSFQFVEQYRSNQSKIQRKGMIERYFEDTKPLQQEIDDYMQTDQTAVNLRTEMILYVKALQAETVGLDEKIAAVQEKLEQIRKEQERIVYEQLSCKIYDYEDQKAGLVAERVDQEQEVIRLAGVKDSLQRKLLTCELNRLYQELRKFEMRKAEVDEKIQALLQKTEDSREEIETIGHQLYQWYTQETERWNVKRAAEEEAYRNASEKEQNAVDEQKKNEQQLFSLSGKIGGLKSQIKHYDETEEAFNREFDAGIHRNILGFYEEGFLEIRKKEMAAELLNQKNQLARSSGKKNDLEQILNNLAQESSDTDLKIHDRTYQIQQTQQKLTDLEQQKNVRLKIMKYVGMEESKIDQKAQILDQLDGKIRELDTARNGLLQKIAEQDKHFRQLKEGKTSELPANICAYMEQNGIDLVYGMEWLARNKRTVQENTELVKKNPFLPYAVLMERDVFERFRKNEEELYTSFPIPIMIKEELEQQGVKSFEDSPEWTISRIRSILQNEKYCGDVLMQKTFRQDFINRKAIKNTGQLPMYLIENHHEGIVSREKYDAVQAEMARRNAAKSPSKNAVTGMASYASKYALSERLVCGECGTLYRRCTWTRNGEKRVVWRCVSRLDYGKKYCHNSPTLDEAPLQQAILAVLNTAMADKNSLIRQITAAMETELIPFPGGTMSLGDIECRLRVLEQQFQTLLEKATDDPAAYGGQFKEILDEQTFLKEKRSVILANNNEQAKANQRIMDAAQTLENASPYITEWDESAVRQLVETVKILSKDEVAVTLKGGIEICQKIMY